MVGVSESSMLLLLYYMLTKQCKEALVEFNNIYMSGIDISLFYKMFFEFIENCVKYLITNNSDIVTITDVTIKWLIVNSGNIMNMKDYLYDLIRFNSNLANEDLKVMLESWIIKRCNL